MGAVSEASEVLADVLRQLCWIGLVSYSYTQPKRKGLVHCPTRIRFAQSSCRQLTKYLLTATVLNIFREGIIIMMATYSLYYIPNHLRDVRTGCGLGDGLDPSPSVVSGHVRLNGLNSLSLDICS